MNARLIRIAAVAALLLDAFGAQAQIPIGRGGSGGAQIYPPTLHGSAATAIAASEHFIVTCNKSDTGCTSGTWGSAATWTLPSHTAVPTGNQIIVADSAGVVTNTKTISLAPNSGDTINGSSNPIVLTVARGMLNCRLDAVLNNWVCVGSNPNGLAGQLIVGQGATTPGQWVTPAGDWSLSALGVATTAKVNGTAYPSGPSTNTVPVVTSANTVTYEAVPNGALANSAVTLNTHTLSLGGTLNLTAADVGAAATGSPSTYTASQTFAEAHGTAYAPSFTGTNYTPVASDCGKTLKLANGQASTITVPNLNPASGECTIKFIQMDGFQYTFQGGGGSSYNSADGFSKTKAQHAVMIITLETPSASSAVWALSGSGA